MLDQRFNARDRRTNARLHHVFGELFFVEDHNFFHIAHAALQVFAERDDLANYDRRSRNRLEHTHLPALDALGDLHFAFARQQRYGAHLAQIHAHGIVGFFKRPRGQVEFDVLALFQFEVLVAAKFWRVQKVDTLGADGCDQIIQVVGRPHLFGQNVVHVAVGEIALVLTGIDKVLDIVFKLLVSCQCSPTLQRDLQI